MGTGRSSGAFVGAGETVLGDVGIGVGGGVTFGGVGSGVSTLSGSTGVRVGLALGSGESSTGSGEEGGVVVVVASTGDDDGARVGSGVTAL